MDECKPLVRGQVPEDGGAHQRRSEAASRRQLLPRRQVGRCKLNRVETRVESERFQRFKLNCHEPLSKLCFQFILAPLQPGPTWPKCARTSRRATGRITARCGCSCLRLGKAVQDAPIKSTLTAPGTQRFKLRNDHLLSPSAVKSSLRRYTAAAGLQEDRIARVEADQGPQGRVTRYPLSIWEMTISILPSPIISLAHIPYRYPG